MELNELAERLFVLTGILKADEIPTPPTQLGKITKENVDSAFARGVYDSVLELEVAQPVQGTPVETNILEAKKIAISGDPSKLKILIDHINAASRYINKNYSVKF